MPDQTLYEQGLPRPQFADRDPQAIVMAIVAEYERLLERKLYPAQVERLHANLQAYRETGVRQAVQYTGEQNLVAFAAGEHLDYLGELLGTYRLGEAPATCTLRFTLSQVPSYSVVISQNTTVARGTGSGQIHWRTAQSAIIRGTIDDGGPTNLDGDGLPYVDVPAIASTNGIIGNGFAPGELNVLVTDPFPYFKSVENIDQTKQGAATETDERFRRRIMLAPEAFSGGSSGSYQYLCLSVSSAISDVSVVQEKPGHLFVYILTADGLPTDAILAECSRALTPDRRRPLTDWVTVARPTEVPITLDLTITPYRGRDSASLEQQVREKLKQFIAQRQPRLGIDVVPSQIIAAVGDLPGVYRVQVNAPTYREVLPGEWAHYSDLIGIAMAEAKVG